ncbi:MAG: DUF1624 domain-containing protein [Methylophilaceae bacterium]
MSKPARQATSASQARYPAIDALRGAAIVLMIAYHFCFDLNQYHHIHQDFYQAPFWLGARAFIVTLFLLIAGISLSLSAQNEGGQSRLKRLLKLAACAALVTLGSMLMFPQSYIFFGVLHFILVASLIGLLMLRCYWLNLVLGIIILLVGLYFAHPVFDQPWLQWVGLMTHKPITEDYVPLLPWLGVVLLGIFTGKNLLARPAWLKYNTRGQPMRGLTWLGKRSLLIYMIHQPILLAGLSAWSWLSLN